MGGDGAGFEVVRAALTDLAAGVARDKMPVVLLELPATIHEPSAAPKDDRPHILDRHASLLEQLPLGCRFRGFAGLDLVARWVPPASRLQFRTIAIEEQQQPVSVIEQEHPRDPALEGGVARHRLDGTSADGGDGGDGFREGTGGSHPPRTSPAGSSP